MKNLVKKWFGESRAKQKLDKVGCFGKLPTQAEFLRLGMNTDAVANLERVLQTAFEQANRQHPGVEIQPLQLQDYFLIQQNEKSPALLGYFQDSIDMSGREYPFVVFRQLQGEDNVEKFSSLPAAFEEFLGKAQQLCQQDWKGKTNQDLQQAIQTLQQQAETLDRRAIENIAYKALIKTTYGDLWQQIMPANMHVMPEAFLYSLAEGLRLQGKAKNLQIILPIGNANAGAQVCFWVRIVEILLGSQQKIKQLFWQVNREQSKLMIQFGALTDAVLHDVLTHQQNNFVIVDPLQQLQVLPEELREDYSIDATTNLIEVIHFWANMRREASHG
tara:strand:+ start:13522 stop:14514 length:993 start_codon:yes stop_codon:yes gene_type:complete